MALFRNERHGYGISTSLLSLAFLALFSGDLGEARARLAASVKGLQEIGSRAFADCLDVSAEIAVRSGAYQRAARLFGAIDGNSQQAIDYNSEQVGLVFHPTYEGAYHAALAAARAALGEEGWARVWAEGQAMTLDEAVEYALRDK